MNNQLPFSPIQKTKTGFLVPAVCFLVFIFGIILFAQEIKAQDCTVYANVDQLICNNSAATLEGTASGSFPGGIAVTEWSQISGPAAVIATPNNLISSVTSLLIDNSYVFRLSSTCLDGTLVFDDVSIIVSSTPAAPVAGLITQPTCSSATGSVLLNDLPAGNWIINPGALTGTGISFELSGLAAGTYNFTVSNAAGCNSPASADIVIDAQPETPLAPEVGTITQPTCTASTGSVVLNGLPAAGTWTLTRSPEGTITSGTGTSSTISGLASGTYTCTVTNDAGCTSVASANIVIDLQPETPLAPEVGTITQPTCAVSTGSVVLNGLPAAGTWTLTRSPGGTITSGTGTSSTISGLATGTYTYTVTNDAGCSSVVSANIVIDLQPETPLVPEVGTITQPTCTVSTGSVELNGLPAAGTWTLTRSPGGTITSGTGPSSTISGLATGTYTYTVTNDAGCTSVASANIVIDLQPETPLAPEVGIITQPTCTVSTGSVELNGLPAAGTWTLTRSPGGTITSGTGTSSTISGLATGTYTYTVTNDAGCTSVASANIVIDLQPETPLAPEVGIITQPTCTVSTGSVVLNGLPAAGTWTLARSPGTITTSGTGTSSTISGLATGTYTYTVTNDAGCTSVASANIVIDLQPETPLAPEVGTITQPTCTVSTGSVVLNSLPATGTWTLTRSPGTITTSGTGTSSTISGLATGTYTYTVTNDAGCTSVASANIVIDLQPETPLAPEVGSITQPTCTVSTGSVVLNSLPATGTWTLTRSPGTITTSGTGPSSTISGLATGTYTYTVTNDAGCTSVASANIVIDLQPETPLAPEVGTITQPTCTVSTGSVVLNSLPATGTWTLTRSPGAVTTSGTGTSSTISGLATGTYTYTVTNAAGCTSLASANIVIDIQPAIPLAPTVGTITQPTCTISTGSVVLNGLPATGTWTLTRSPGGITTSGTGPSSTISGLATGTYTYTVTNDAGCTSVASANIVIDLQPETPLAPEVGTITQPMCTVSTGSVVLNGLPATGTWTLTRFPGAITTSGTGTSSTISGLATGTYTYTVTNASGCSSVASVNIVIDIQPATPLAPIVGTITQPTCTISTGSVVLNGLPATGTWTLTRFPGAITTSGTGTSSTISGLATGTYSYTVTNAAGCTSVASANIVIDIQPATPLAPTVGTITQPTCTISTGSVVLNGLPATGTWTLTRSPGGITSSGTGPSSTISGLATGTYTYTVTNDAGCTSVASANIVIDLQPETPLAPEVGTITQPTCTVSTGSVVLNGLPATGTWTLTRFPGAITTSGTGTSSTISGLATGTYTYTVTNAAGCTSVASANIFIDVQPATPLAPIVGTITQPTCTISTGSVVLNGLPATGTWTLTRSPGGITSSGTGTSSTISGLATGTYTYTVTNASGCSSVASVNIVIDIQPATPSAPAVGTITQPTCTVSTGSVVLTGLPATGTWTLTRSPGGTTTSGTGTSSTISGLATGTYTYTVTNAAGCTSVASANILIDIQPATPLAPIVGTITQPTCTISTGNVVLNGLPATGTWTLTRSQGAVTTSGTGTSSTISGLATGTYTYTVTNAAGCTSVTSANIVIDAQPATPLAPIVGTITQPTCTVSTGSVVLNGLPATGTWTLTRSPGTITTSGTGTSSTILGLVTGIYTYTVTNAAGCTSVASVNIVIDIQPATPTAPTVGTITQPTCTVSTGSVVLIGLPASGNWTLTRSPGAITTSGTGTSSTISGLVTGIYTYTVTNAAGCTSVASANIVIDVQPATPTAPTVGTITQPTCTVSTGSVVLNGLPASGNWTLTRSPGGITTSGTGTSSTISGLAAGTYTYTVTNVAGCTSVASANIVIITQPETPVITNQTTSILTGGTFIVSPGGVPAGTTYTWTTPSYSGGVTGGSAQPIPQTSISGTLSLPAGTGTATYTVTPAAGLCIGPLFTVTVTVTSLCIPVSINSQPANNTMCSTTGNISIDVITNGTSPFTYQWQFNNGGIWSNVINGIPANAVYANQNTSTLNVSGISASGSYQYRCYITNCSGGINSTSNAATLTVNSTPSAPTTGTITQPTCTVATGSVVLNGLPATGNWTLTRNPGGTTTSGTGASSTITGLAAGTYTFTVTNAAGCTSIASSNIVINAQPATPFTPTVGSISQPTCSVATGSVVLNDLPATGNWTLTRNPGGTTSSGTGTSSTITGLATGTYTYTVTNAAGCTSAASASIVINAQPATPSAPTAGSITQPNCTVATGSVILNGLPSTGNWTLTRNPGGTITSGTGTSSTITGLAAGTYTYTVTNAAGCASGSSASIVINAQPATPSAPTVGSITHPTCTVATGSVILNGLPATGNWTLTRNPGGTTTSGTGTSSTLTGLTSGTYTYTVTNAAGCTSGASAAIVINAQPATPSAPTLGLITQPTCNVATGSVVLNGLPATGNWTLTRNPGGATTSGTGTSSTITGLPAGTYTYTVTNAAGCTSITSDNIIINAQPATPSAPAIGAITQPSCSVASGSVVLNGLPAEGTWTVTRNPGGITISGTGTSSTVAGIAPGTYSFTVTNSQGCTSVASTGFVIEIQPASPSAPTAGPITQPTCTVATGSVVLNSLPATGTWILTRNPGGITTSGTGSSTTITGLAPGTYSFTVTNATGCISVASSDIVIDVQPVTPSAPAAGPITQPTCSVATGSVLLNGLPETGNWTLTRYPEGTTTSGSGTSLKMTGLAPGTYTYTVTNSQGCTSIPSVEIIINVQPATPSAPTIGTITQPSCPVATGSVELNGLPAEGTWTLTRNPGGIITSGTGTSSTITGLPSGTYTFTVTNAPGCISLPSANIVINTQPATPSEPTVGPITQPDCTVATGSVVLDGLPETGIWTLTEHPGGTSTSGTGISSTITGLVTGSYTYTVTNASGCTSIASADIVIDAQPVTPSAPAVGPITQPSCLVATGSVVLNGLPAPGTWTLTRTPGGITSSGTGTSSTITGLASGTYSYTVSNVSGCTSIASADIVIGIQPATPSAPATGTITQPTCTVGTGSIVLNSLPASGSWTLTRYPDGTTITGAGISSTITGLANGTYTFTVTNSQGCTSTATGEIIIGEQPATPPAPAVGSVTQPTCIVATGSVVLTGLPATGTWMLTRNPGGTTFSGTGTSSAIAGLETGTYTYNVTNSDGCISIASVPVVIDVQPAIPPAPTIGSIIQPTCLIQTGTITITSPTGTGITYSIDGSAYLNTTGVFITMPPGTYTVTAKSAAGCISQGKSISINQKPDCFPFAVNDVNTTTKDLPVSGNVSVNDTPSGDGGNVWILAGSNGNAVNGTVNMNTDGTYTYTPNTNSFVSDTIYYQLCDADGDCSTATVTITIVEKNLPPVANYDSGTTITGESLTVNILGNDSDPENGILAVTLCAGPLHGTVEFNNDSTLQYIPFPGFSGNDSLCYTVCDAGNPALCTEAMVYIQVIPLVIYNALTPNGDGSNDGWKINGIEDFPDNKVKIFNRWGDIIYEGTHYDNRNVYWDGSNRNNVLLPDGAYYYILEIKGIKTFTGWIYIRDAK